MCVDFFELKKIMVKNRYPLPHINDLLDKLKYLVYFTQLESQSGYCNIWITNGDVWKTDFKKK